ncbi:YfhO family protein [Chloroflexota bacterium]
MMNWLKQVSFSLTCVLANHKADIKYILLILLTSLVFFWKILLFPEQLIYGPGLSGSDTVNFFYPLYNYAYTILHNGDFPFWNSLILSGYPLAANPQFALFYPLNSLFLFLPAATAFGFSYFLHIFLGGTFMYLLAKHFGLDRVCAFLSAIVFIFGAFITSHVYAGHYTMICAAIWLPLLFLLFDMALTRKSLMLGLVAGVVLGIQLLAGHIQITYLSLIALSLYLAYKLFFTIKDRDYRNILKPIIIMAVMLIAGILLSAVHLFPTYEYSMYSTRAGGLSYEWATSFSLKPEMLNLLLTNYWTGPSWVSGDMPVFEFWEYSSYIGILPLFLVFLAILFFNKNRYVIFFFLLAVISIFLAFGEYFSPYWLLYKFVPGFDMFRAPARFILLFSFASAILAGFGFSFLRNKLNREQVKYILKILTVLPVLAILIIITAIFTTTEFSAIWVGMITLAILIVGSIGVIYLRIKKRLSGRCFDIVVTSFILLNLLFFHMPLIDVKPTTDIYQIPSYAVYLQEHSEGYRVYDPEGIIPYNYFMTLGISKITGYDATALNHYSEFLGDSAGIIGSNYSPSSTTESISNLGVKLDLLNVKYVLSSKSLTDSDFKLVYSFYLDVYMPDLDVYIYEYLNALPRAYIVHNAEVISSENDALARLTDDAFDIRSYIILQENPVNISLLNESGINYVSLEQYSPQEIVIETTSETPGFLVLSESWYPSWKVYIDGNPSEIYKTDYALMSVYIDSGNHSVQFVYEDQTFKIGILISCATVLLLTVILVIYAIKIRRPRVFKK